MANKRILQILIALSFLWLTALTVGHGHSLDSSDVQIESTCKVCVLAHATSAEFVALAAVTFSAKAIILFRYFNVQTSSYLFGLHFARGPPIG